MTMQKNNVDLYLHDEVLLNNSDIKYAKYTLCQDKPGVKLIMTDKGKKNGQMLQNKTLEVILE